MNKKNHMSATSSHYDKEASSYDLFNEEKSKVINQTLETIFKEHHVKTILDLSCGTGSQAFYLTQKGFTVTSYDISPTMIKLALEKATQTLPHIPFFIGDMRTTQAGTFDAVITIFNSIGHLTKQDFEQTIQNIWKNLKPGGLYVFDIFNLNYLLENDNITKLTIDWLKKTDTKIVREIQYSTINQDGILASYDMYHEQYPDGKEKTDQAFQTLQIYSKNQLTKMLKVHSFKVIQQCSLDGNECHDTETERIITVAKKIGE